MKKKILHLTFDMRIGGTEQVIKNLIEGNHNEQLQMSIFCLEEPIGPFGQMLLEDGIVINSTQRHDGFDLKLIKVIRRYLKTNHIDILHCHQYTPWVYGTIAALGTKTKIIFTEHGRFYPDRTSWKRKVVNPLLNLFTHKISAISKATKQALVDFEYIPQNKIEVIYNGIHAIEKSEKETKTLKKHLSIDDSMTILGTIARLDPIKNHQMMLEAFNIVLQEQPNTKLILVGDGEERESLEKLAKQLNLGDHIIFTGYITKPDRYLECMDIFLLPSLSEGTSMTLLEAMSLSKPCVVTDAGGNSEIIKNDINGFVSENNNANLFAENILKLINSDKLMREFSRNNKEQFHQKFNVNNMVTSYVSLYKQILSSTGYS